jgi:malate synthase
MTTRHVSRAGLDVAAELAELIRHESWPGRWRDARGVLAGPGAAAAGSGTENRALLARRDDLQAQIDTWRRRKGQPFDAAAARRILRSMAASCRRVMHSPSARAMSMPKSPGWRVPSW